MKMQITGQLELMPDVMEFGNTDFRRIMHSGEWFYSVVDVIGYLVGTVDAKSYWTKVKAREFTGDNQQGTIWSQLKMLAPDGKRRLTDAANREGLLRIIQSVPSDSEKVEAIKKWLAKVGNEFVEESKDPDRLAKNSMERLHAYYQKRDYPDHWIKERIAGIFARNYFTDTLGAAGVRSGDYKTVTAVITKASIGKRPSEIREQYDLSDSDKVRDHLDTTCLSTINLGESLATREIQINKSQGVAEVMKDVTKVAGTMNKVRSVIEKELGRAVLPRYSPIKHHQAQMQKRQGGAVKGK